jgi:hypothetical protein
VPIGLAEIININGSASEDIAKSAVSLTPKFAQNPFKEINLSAVFA